jgi:hypothetical protein
MFRERAVPMRPERLGNSTHAENFENLGVANDLGVQRQELGTGYAIGGECLRKSATDSARHSSIEEETSPSTEPAVCPGLYQDVLPFAVQTFKLKLHRQHNGPELTLACQ